MNNSKCIALLAAMLLLVLSACNRKLVYDRYLSTPISGWEKNDTLSYDIRPVSGTDTYDMWLRRSLSVHSYNADSRAAYLSKGYHCQRHGELQAYRPSRQCIGHWCQLPPVPFPRNRTAIAGRRLNTHTCTSRYEARDIAGYQRRRHFATTQVG